MGWSVFFLKMDEVFNDVKPGGLGAWVMCFNNGCFGSFP
jgi:hypothetical protein